ncbi:armadillo-type protein, partial [Dunaliella salina]
AIINNLSGRFAELSLQKFSSNVVEKCLKLGGVDAARENIIREVISSPLLPRLLQDGYGNYVVQSSLSVSTGPLHEAVVEAVRPHLATLRGTPHGKRILQRISAR